MMRILTLLSLALLVVLAVGCSDDNNPTNSGTNPVAFTDTTWYDAAAGVYRSQIDASSQDNAAYFSFADATTKSAADWDLSFERYVVNTNSGASAEGTGHVEAAVLKDRTYESVTLADTAGANWMVDTLAYAIDGWYFYNPTTHALAVNGRVFSMLDAEGDNYIKLRVDSMVGNGMPPNMGTVYMTYFYQSTPNSLDLSGATQSVVIPVGANTVYFDFSSGQVVTPADPLNSTAWDIGFSSYNIMTNSGPNGSASCFSFPAYTELTAHSYDSTNIDAFTAQPAKAQMFPDYIKSVFNRTLSDDLELDNWYSYANTELTSRSYVYLIKTDTACYKMQIDSYYAIISGLKSSAHYSYMWNKL